MPFSGKGSGSGFVDVVSEIGFVPLEAEAACFLGENNLSKNFEMDFPHEGEAGLVGMEELLKLCMKSLVCLVLDFLEDVAAGGARFAE